MSALRADRDTTEEDAAPEVSDDGELRGLGVCRCNVGASVDLSGWADEYAKVTPLSGFAEDGEYAQYRNIMDDEAFPFAAVKAALTSCVEANFVSSMGKELRLDDAFAIHCEALQLVRLSRAIVPQHCCPILDLDRMCVARAVVRRR